MDTPLIIGLAIGFVIAMLEVFKQEAVKQLIKKFFENASPQTISAIFITLLVLSVLIPTGAGYMFSESQDTPQAFQEPQTPPRSEFEEYIDAAVEVKEVVDEAIEDKRRNDSIRRSHREQIWVYQIGLQLEGKRQVTEVYKQVSFLENVKAFKTKKKSYFLYKDTGQSKEELEQGLEALQESIDSLDIRISVIDLMERCPLKKSPTRIKDIKVRRSDNDIPCYECVK